MLGRPKDRFGKRPGDLSGDGGKATCQSKYAADLWAVFWVPALSQGLSYYPEAS